jgi:hypothetical protein
MPKKEAPENTGPLSLAYSRSDEYLSRRDREPRRRFVFCVIDLRIDIVIDIENAVAVIVASVTDPPCQILVAGSGEMNREKRTGCREVHLSSHLNLTRPNVNPRT